MKGGVFEDADDESFIYRLLMYVYKNDVDTLLVLCALSLRIF